MAASAEELMDLTEEQWVVNETPEFRAHLKNFWVVLEGLKTSAESEGPRRGDRRIYADDSQLRQMPQVPPSKD